MTTYYRLALLETQTGLWRWKTTVLHSPETVSRWINMFGSFPPDQLRVFTSSLCEYLDEMLILENLGVPSGSMTVEQFLLIRPLQSTQQGTRNSSMPETQEQRSDVPTASAVSAPGYAYDAMLCPHDEKDLSILNGKRLDIEQGPGGDHDTPYRFSLPMELSQLQAWIHLQDSICTEK